MTEGRGAGQAHTHHHHGSRHAEHDAHQDHGAPRAEHDAHHHGAPHPEHDAHAGHHDPEVFRRRFWVCLVLALPLMAASPMFQEWFGYELTLPGTDLVGPVLGTAVFLYGGLPFLTGAVARRRARLGGRRPRPGRRGAAHVRVHHRRRPQRATPAPPRPQPRRTVTRPGLPLRPCQPAWVCGGTSPRSSALRPRRPGPGRAAARGAGRGRVSPAPGGPAVLPPPRCVPRRRDGPRPVRVRAGPAGPASRPPGGVGGPGGGWRRWPARRAERDSPE